ncbi:molybdenum cofactor sulfurase [Caldalkalibacillus thermarum]|uniref:MOSC domain-containing protein n=1 Tax=Caldalkalibacillus thermarum TaxID=296745 RepID=UPI001663107A|nr:MOSC domain-containing protein [Caldalkalibacillus thermarum]GGK32236.1 molybdenum cofactor sulfurase [Caldalkalibacillus thermarum]
MLIGHIKSILRYPVKSFSGEQIKKTNVMPYGLYGDRSHGLMDENRPGKFLTLTQWPEMVCYQAKFSGRESLEEYPQVQVKTPEGKTLIWGDQQLIQELEQRSQRKVSPVNYRPGHVPLGAIEEEHIQLVTDASLTRLSELWGREVDVRRFRPNFLIQLIDFVPFIEDTWIGRRLKIGEQVELEVQRHCERCMIITINPADGTRDPSFLKTVVRHRQNRFGVYATVVKTGVVVEGDPVVMI